MDIYDYLKNNKYIKTENEYFKNLTESKIRKKMDKYDITVKKIDDTDSSDSIEIYTSIDEYNKVKKKKINKYIGQDKQIYTDDEINNLFNKYSNLLKNYIYIENLEELKLGGYIRYINIKKEIKYGGILVAINKKDDLINCKLVLKNFNNQYWKISFINNYIFYRTHITKNDKFRKLFLEMIK